MFNHSSVSGDVNVITGSTNIADATANTLAINSALSSGTAVLPKNSIVYVNNRLIMQSWSTLDLSGSTIRRIGAYDNMIVTQSLLDPDISVSLSWTSGVALTVSWTDHGKSAGDYVCLVGSPATTGAPASFAGVHRIVSVIDTGSFTVYLPKVPGAAPSGQWKAKSPTRNYTIKNGVIDFTGAQIVTQMGTHAVYNPFSLNSRLENLHFLRVYKYCVFSYGVLDFYVHNLSADTDSDGVHVFGPARLVHIDGVSGSFGDDIVACSPRDLTGNWVDVSGGDVIGFKAENISGTTPAHVCQMYAHDGYRLCDIEFNNVSGYSTIGRLITIWGDTTAGGTVESVVFRKISGCGRIRFGEYNAGTGQLVINSVVFSECNLDSDVNSDNLITMWDDHVRINKIALIDCVSTYGIGATQASYILELARGQVESVVVRGGSYKLGSSGRFLGLTKAGALGLKTVNIDGASFIGTNLTGASTIITKSSACTDVPSIRMDGVYGKNVIDAFGLSSSANIMTDMCVFEDVYNVVHLYNALAVVSHWDNGTVCNYNLVAVGSGTYNPKSLGIKIDIGSAGVGKTAGNLAYNTGSGRGSIQQNRHVTCNGTNWVQIDTPANVF